MPRAICKPATPANRTATVIYITPAIRAEKPAAPLAEKMVTVNRIAEAMGLPVPYPAHGLVYPVQQGVVLRIADWREGAAS